jgi:16S rRNA (cytosine967-C5)-methyltransferase
LPIEAVAADALAWRPGRPVSAVLLDAPCTTTGAIRRHPDVPYLKSPDDVARLAVVQENLLRAAIEMLAPGGTLVYCTCSLEPEEGPRQIDMLLGAGAPIARRQVQACEIGGHGDWITAEGDLRTLPCHLPEYEGLDGFFCARLTKIESSV